MATRPITNVPIIAEIMVARKTAPHSMPAWLNKPGFTTMIYAIAKNVVKPAITSFPTVVPFCLSLNRPPIKKLTFLFILPPARLVPSKQISAMLIHNNIQAFLCFILIHIKYKSKKIRGNFKYLHAYNIVKKFLIILTLCQNSAILYMLTLCQNIIKKYDENYQKEHSNMISLYQALVLTADIMDSENYISMLAAYPIQLVIIKC